MRLHYWAGETSLDDVRPLTSPEVASSTLAVDLDRSYAVAAPRVIGATSPLSALLGTVGTDSPTRRLDLAVWGAGLDWAWQVLGRKPRRTGSSVRGTEIVAVVDEALGRLSGALELLDRAAARFEDGPLLAGLKQLEGHVAGVRREVGLFYPGEGGPILLDAQVSDDLVGLAAVEMLLRFRVGERAARCAHCGCTFFYAERSDEVYCRRLAPDEPSGGRTCRQVGPQRRYAAKIDEFTVIYRRRYKRLDQRARRGTISRAGLDEWRTKASRFLEAAREQKWTAGEFARRLDAVEERIGGTTR